MTFQDQASGGVALWAIDTDSNAVVWKTIVGAPWVAEPAPRPPAARLTLIGRDGREVVLDAEQIKPGRVSVEGMPRPGEFSLPAGQRLRLESAGKTIEAIVPRRRLELPLGARSGEAGRLAEDRLAGRAGGRADRLGRRRLDSGP